MQSQRHAGHVLGGVLLCGAASAALASGAYEPPPQLQAVEVTSTNGVVVCDSAAAARAGARMLEGGGNAVDAAVAAALALGVDEIGASGLGGQTYILICPTGKPCVAVDGSASAPFRSSRLELKSLQETGQFFGHRLVATPGTLAALDLALTRFGTKPLAEVIQPAIEDAETGVTFSDVSSSFLKDYLQKLRESPTLSSLLLDSGLYPWGPEHIYCFPDLACTLRRIAAGGAREFYSGAIAGEIADDMRRNGGYLGRDDLARIRATEQRPYTGSYRGYEVVSFPLPGGGGALIEALQILDTFPVERLQADGVDRYSLQIEAARLAMADENSVRIPASAAGEVLIDRDRARRRAAQILPDRALTPEELGDTEVNAWSDRDTTQLSVMDRFGNAVSITQTLGRFFGADVATPGLGFPYNCMLEGFDLEHGDSRSFLLPMRPPFTTQAPTIVRRDGKPFLVLGSVGTGRILSAILITISNVLDEGMDLKSAVEAPRVLWGGNQENRVYLELAGPITDAVADALAARGYKSIYRLRFPSDQVAAFGSVNSILAEPGGRLVGVGDPRRTGAAVAARPAGAPLAPAFLPECWRALWALPGAPAGGER